MTRSDHLERSFFTPLVEGNVLRFLTGTEFKERKFMPIEKNSITVKTFFDGELDATDLFVSLIADKISAHKKKDTIDNHDNVIYNKNANCLDSSGVTEARQ